MDISLVENILYATVRSGTPLVLVALGEMVCEKSGALNLGQEGMMLMGAVAGFIAAVTTGSTGLGVLAAIGAGTLMALLFAVLSITLVANQVATGLALTIFASGLSAFVGAGYIGMSIAGLAPVKIPLLSALPLIGPALFAQDVLVYLSFVCAALIYFCFTHTRLGLIIRAAGENPQSATAIGLSVPRIRYAAVLFGGAMAGLAGGYVSLAYTPLWSEGMTAGRGWIALALVVFASWRTERVLLGAYLFGLTSIMHLLLQSYGYSVSSNLLATAPYIATIIVLVVIARGANQQSLLAPRALGMPYRPQD